jgi:hypothetical protein
MDQGAGTAIPNGGVMFAMRFDFAVAPGGPPGFTAFAAPTMATPPRGRIDNVQPDASSPLDLGGVNDANAPGVQLLLGPAGKAAETTPSTAVSAVVPAATGRLPLQLTPLGSMDSTKGVMPAADVLASGAVERTGGAPSHGGARAGVSRSSALRSMTSNDSGADLSAALGGDLADGLPRPMGADLIGEFLPFQRTSLDRAVNRFLQQFNDVDVRELVEQNPAHIVLFSLTVTSSVVALDLARRRWQRGALRTADVRVRDLRASRDHLGFPELPGSWSSRLT